MRPVLDGTTLNLGRLGALVVALPNDSNAIPKAGEEVSLEILLPAHQQFGQRCLSCEAVALRVDRDQSNCRIGLQFLRVEIRKVAVERPSAAASMAVM